MWWDPFSETEAEVFYWLKNARELFLSGKENALVFGIGSYLSTQGLRPLLLINEYRFREYSAVPTFLPYELLPEVIQKELNNWELPRSSVILPVASPETFSASPTNAVTQGGVVRCRATGEQGTIGVSVEGLNNDGTTYKGVLTAGHVTPQGVGSVMEIVQHSWLGTPSYSTIGDVTLCEDPAYHSAPGYDVSVIRLNSGSFLNGFNAGIASVHGPLSAPVLCTMYGGKSGTVTYTSIVGALMAYGTGPVFSNSWLFCPASVAQLGDSGSAVRLNSTSEAVGLLVGGSRGVNATQYLCWYAQDLYSIQNDVLSPNNITVQ